MLSVRDADAQAIVEYGTAVGAASKGTAAGARKIGKTAEQMVPGDFGSGGEAWSR